MRISNLIGNAYYFINDWFETKRHSIYVRFGFEPTTILFGVKIVSLRLFTIYVPFFHLCIHWLKKDPDRFGRT